MPDVLSAVEAAATLGVTRQTLYAYVSRGLLTALPGSDHRESLYSRAAVTELAKNRRRGRRPKEIAKGTLDWGLPVLESAITLIDRGRLYYRGRDAIELADSSSVEAVAALLWQLPEQAAFGPGAAEPPGRPRDVSAVVDEPGILLRRFILTTDDDESAWQLDPARLAAGCGKLVRGLVASILEADPSDSPLHEQCARVWKLDPEGADAVRRALILCADHDLNASSFTARCIASTGAGLRAAIIGGLAALSGHRHGGMTERVETLFRSLAEAGGIRNAVRRMLAAGSEIPGFGHPLYPDGDVRAKAIMDALPPTASMPRELAAAIFELTGRHPSLDFALVSLRRSLALPEGAAFGLFAAGRSIGWIAQALEQRAVGTLIRPRGVYIGPQPASGTAWSSAPP